MRAFGSFGLVVVAAMTLALPAAAENRIFIIANNADGYGIDRCLANGERCGTSVAAAYCQSHAFAEAKSFRKIARDDITGAVPTSGANACAGSCDTFVAIECSR